MAGEAAAAWVAKISTMGDMEDPDLVFFSQFPPEVDAIMRQLSRGEAAGDALSEVPCFWLDEARPGIRLASLLGNYRGCLIVASDFRRVLDEVCAETEIEYLPIDILDHRGRLHGEDHAIVNCLVSASVVTEGPLPALFRDSDAPWEIYVRSDVAAALEAAALTNVRFTTRPVGGRR